MRRAEGTRGVLLEQCMDLRAERWLAPLAGESKGRTAPHGTGGNVSGAVRPLHALGVERHLRAPAGPRERGTYCSGTCSVRTDPGVSGVPPNKAFKLTRLGWCWGEAWWSAACRGCRCHRPRYLGVRLASQLNAGVERTPPAATGESNGVQKGVAVGRIGCAAKECSGCAGWRRWTYGGESVGRRNRQGRQRRRRVAAMERS